MHILVTNDDGVTAPGLLALVQAIREIGEVTVTVLAPDRNWSASGHVKTMHRPLRVNKTMLADGTPALTTDGAPSDAVALPRVGVGARDRGVQVERQYQRILDARRGVPRTRLRHGGVRRQRGSRPALRPTLAGRGPAGRAGGACRRAAGPRRGPGPQADTRA